VLSKPKAKRVSGAKQTLLSASSSSEPSSTSSSSSDENADEDDNDAADDAVSSAGSEAKDEKPQSGRIVRRHRMQTIAINNPGVCLSCGWAVQKRLNRLMSCMCGYSWVPKEQCIRPGFQFLIQQLNHSA